MFSPETTCNKFYGDNKVVKTIVQIYCENRNNCDAVEQYLEGRKEEKDD